MAKLTTNEKQLLEKIFQMDRGYVLNFSDRTMGEFFKNDMGINIYDAKYQYASGSKANYMRGFWQVADDPLIGKSIHKLIEYVANQILLGNLKPDDFPQELMKAGKGIANKLLNITPKEPEIREEDFIKQDFKNVSIDRLGLDSSVSYILQQRIAEINHCLSGNAPLAVIFLCGSTLEGVLLGVATKNPQTFNQSSVSPKDSADKVKPFHHWTLSDFINVARDLRLIGEDVKKFSHALRDFRNYIHPYQQMSSNFDPDVHTAKICWQVLQAAITQLSK